MQEPKDGDFVAYVEALQRESAARLAQHHVQVADPASAPSSGPHFGHETGASTPTTDAASTFVPHDGAAKLVKAAVAAVAGAVFLLNWLGNGGAFSFILAAALLAYALPRLLPALRRRPQQPSNQARIEQVFGRSHGPTTGTRK